MRLNLHLDPILAPIHFSAHAYHAVACFTGCIGGLEVVQSDLEHTIHVALSRPAALRDIMQDLGQDKCQTKLQTEPVGPRCFAFRSCTQSS